MKEEKEIKIIKKTIYMRDYIEKMLRMKSAETGESQSLIMEKAFFDLYMKELKK